MLNGRLFDDVDGNITCTANEGRSLVDYIIASTSLFDKFSHFCIDTHYFSDHFPVTCTLVLQQSHWEEFHNESDNDTETYMWNKYKWKETLKRDFLEKFRVKFAHFKNRVQIGQNDIAQVLQSFVQVFQQAGDQMEIKLSNKNFKEQVKRQPEWWDQSCLLQKSKKFKALKKYRSSNDKDDFSRYKIERNHFKSICKRKKKELQKQKRAKLIEVRNKPKEFWKAIKSNNKVSNKKTDISNDDWVTYFQTLFAPQEAQPEINQNHPLYNITQDNNSDSLDSPITDIEIRRAINKLKSDRSGGPDGLCIEMFKSVVDDTSEFLAMLFNNIYNTGFFPENWCKSIISPIHKSGPVNKTENYRAIALINCLCKIFMTILTTRLTEWANLNDVIDESQAGFRKGYNTIDNIFSLQSIVQKYLSKERGRFYCTFVNFKRAFDSIHHASLWFSLERKGINPNGKFLFIFKSMYSQLKSCVKVKNGLTQFFDCYIGTRQGCVSSPIIFSLFINDLVSYLKAECDRGIFVTDQIDDMIALMFADDVACFSDTIIRLQHQINCIHSFCESVGMSLNLLKTKIIVFRKGGILKQMEKWYYNGQLIDIVPFYKYLGVYFTPFSVPAELWKFYSE